MEVVREAECCNLLSNVHRSCNGKGILYLLHFNDVTAPHESCRWLPYCHTEELSEDYIDWFVDWSDYSAYVTLQPHPRLVNTQLP